MKWFSFLTAVISAFLLIDSITFVITGQGVIGNVMGGSSIVDAISTHIVALPSWAFWAVSALSVVVLSVIISASYLASYRMVR